MQNIFSETEKDSIATVLLKIIAADKKFEKEELNFMHALYSKYDIPLALYGGSKIGYQEATECISKMDDSKKGILADILRDLAASDSDTDKSELEIIEQIITA